LSVLSFTIACFMKQYALHSNGMQIALPEERLPANATLRRRLMVATVLAEAIIIPTCAWTAFRLAGGDIGITAPLLAVSALEACRIPLSSYATRLKLKAKLTAILALAGIGVLTGEVMTVGFASLLDARLAPITEAAAERDAAREHLDAERAVLDRLGIEVVEARGSLADLSSHAPALAEVRSQTCLGRRGRSFDCTPISALRANAATQAAYDSRLKQAQETLGRAQERLRASPGVKDAEQALRASETHLRAAMAANPMARLAEGFTDAQLDRVKSVVAVSLGFALAFATSLMAFLAHLQPRDDRPGKVARAARALLARWRRPIRRDVPGPVQYRERVRVIYLPTDPVSGRVLDPDEKAKA
jgi:hypothetical protein